MTEIKINDCPDLTPSGCPFCDFSSGQRGMDRCAKCDGTGSVFLVNGRRFANTLEGYLEACQEAGIEPVLEPARKEAKHD